MENRDMKKKFTLAEYIVCPFRKIETRDGKSVRIICTDATGLNKKPIIALVKQSNGDETPHSYWPDGIHTRGYENDPLDLFWKPDGPSYRPYTQGELWKEIQKRNGSGWVCQKGYSHYDLITRIDEDNIGTADIGKLTYTEALEELTWADNGEVFGVKL